MQKYDNKELISITCNQCGKVLNVKNGYCVEGVVPIKYTFGYFTKKDGVCHEFDLCEECYDSFVNNFKIPVNEKEAWDFQ